MCSASESGVCCGRHGPCCCGKKLKQDNTSSSPPGNDGEMRTATNTAGESSLPCGGHLPHQEGTFSPS